MTRRGWRQQVGALAVVALVLTACGETVPDEPEAADAPTTEPAAETAEPDAGEQPASEPMAGEGTAVTVEVLDVGEEPREPLRYAYEPDSSITGTFAFVFEMTSLVIDGQAAPGAPPVPMEADVAVEVGDVDSEGAELRFTFGETRLGDVDLPDEVRREAEAQFAVLEGTGGTFRIDGRGHVSDTDIEFEVPGFEQLGDQLATLSAPLPDEPVGPGATWTVTQVIDLGGIDQEQVIEVRFTGRDGDTLTFEQTVTGGSAAGPVDLGLGDGVEVELVRSELEGSGSNVVDLTRPLPSRSDAEVFAEQELLIDEGAGPSTLEQAIRMRVGFELD